MALGLILYIYSGSNGVTQVFPLKTYPTQVPSIFTNGKWGGLGFS